jgi:hypothetical protein
VGVLPAACVPKTLYGALVVKSDFHSFPCLTSSPILLFGPRRSHSSAPAARSERRRAQRAVKDGPVFGATASAARSVLDGREHDGRMRRPGATRFASLVRQLRPLIATSQRGRDLGLMCDTASCSRATKSEASSLLVLR